MRSMELIQNVESGVGIVLGLAIAASGAIVLRRSTAAAGFIAIAGIGWTIAGVILFATSGDFMIRHALTRATMATIHSTVAFGRAVTFYGGLALALRSLALARGAR